MSPPRLRIIAISGQFRPLVGGTETQTARLAAEWASRGHHVEVWTRRLESDHPVEEKEGGARVRRLGWASRARFLRLRRVERLHFSIVLMTRLIAHRNEYDVVIAQQALYPAVVAAIASWITGRPLVLRVASTGVTSDFEGWGAITSVVLALFRRQAGGLVVLNRQGAREAQTLGFAAERIHEIPNGLEIGAPPPPQPRNPAPRVVYVGGLRTEKRVDLLLRAWARAGSLGELVLAGAGPTRASLVALAEQLSISPTFLGDIPHPRTLMREADIFVLSSDAEGMSNALVEAMAEGCACLATWVGGNIDCLAPESTAPPDPGGIVRGSAGWLVGCGDEAAMAEALMALGRDPDLRGSLGERARERAMARHSLEKTARVYTDLLGHLVQRATSEGTAPDPDPAEPPQQEGRTL